MGVDAFYLLKPLLGETAALEQEVKEILSQLDKDADAKAYWIQEGEAVVHYLATNKKPTNFLSHESREWKLTLMENRLLEIIAHVIGVEDRLADIIADLAGNKITSR